MTKNDRLFGLLSGKFKPETEHERVLFAVMSMQLAGVDIRSGGSDTTPFPENCSKEDKEMLELQVKPALLTLPKFVWDILERIPMIESTQGFELYIGCVVYLLSLSRSRTKSSMLETMFTMIEKLDLRIIDTKE